MSVPVHVAAIIPAAGRGDRLRTSDPHEPVKALRALAGRSLLTHAVEALAPHVQEILVVLPPDLAHRGASALGLDTTAVTVRVVAGGDERQDSVRNALTEVAADARFVLVHDAARPLVPPAVILRVIAALEAGAACVVPVEPVEDSVRLVAADGSSASIDRTTLRRVQTPQGFTLDVLRRAHLAALTQGTIGTDDASLVEAIGVPAVLVDGDPLGMKITRPLDLEIAAALLRARPVD